MSEWKEKTLGELSIRVSSGLTPLKSNKEFWENPIIPWLKTDQLGEKYIFDTNTKISKEALEQTSLRIYPENTISIAMYGEGKTRGNLSIIKAPMTTNQACCNIELDTKLADVEYVYYYLKTQYDALRKLSSGVRKNLNSNDIKNYKIYIPESVSFQKSIVRILTSLDNKISVNNQINQELEAMAKTLYDYWFVQFDFPDQNGKPYKSSGGKMIYHPELKREIPEGWGVENLFDIADVQYGYPFSTDYFNGTGEGVPVIRIRDILGNDITNYSTEEVEDKYKINVGDVLIGMDGNFHMNYWIKEDCYLNQRVVKVNSDKLPNMVLKYQIEPFIRLREKSVSRTTVGHLSDKDLKAINVILPKDKYLSSIFEKFEIILENIIINQQQNQELTQLRDWLLPMLMNGQAKVE
ncbi:restriction endonuclease subunit S [Streptococcus sp. HMSC062D07]|uniref:restriction endonuclease subunit S n=1 Tax=Streptococcus sp. HMSC062D07 TaxID=1739461 RepID=UPI0008A5DC6A|nr:restriction endonuclease subunit S [Streptococcus sp. HMSC062D07]OFQ04781.1 restriction endonuclease subunit S [Streptococcus sp. HMSC062D07]